MAMIDIYPLIIVFLADLAGALGRAVYPWLQQKKANEDLLRVLDMVPPEKLTAEQRMQIAEITQPLNFRRYYLFTTAVGLIGTLIVTVGSISLLITTLPENFGVAAAVLAIPMVFMSGWGGGSFSNQLLSSKSGTADAINRATVTTLLAKADNNTAPATTAAKPFKDGL